MHQLTTPVVTVLRSSLKYLTRIGIAELGPAVNQLSSAENHTTTINATSFFQNGQFKGSFTSLEG